MIKIKIMKNNISPFYVGQKVVCVNDAFSSHGKQGESIPKKGSTYTIRDVINESGRSSVTLVEIINDKMMYENYLGQVIFGECRFFADRFKPLQELKAPLLTFEKIREEEKEEVLILN